MWLSANIITHLRKKASPIEKSSFFIHNWRVAPAGNGGTSMWMVYSAFLSGLSIYITVGSFISASTWHLFHWGFRNASWRRFRVVRVRIHEGKSPLLRGSTRPVFLLSVWWSSLRGLRVVCGSFPCRQSIVLGIQSSMLLIACLCVGGSRRRARREKSRHCQTPHMLKLVDSVRHGACLACLWACGNMAYIYIYIY